MSTENLRVAEQTWDHFDLDMARRVAWLSFKPIADTGQLDIPKDWNLTIYIHSLLRERMTAAAPQSDQRSLRGCALVCGDMVAERYFFQMKDFVAFARVDGFDLSSESLKKVSLEGVPFVPRHGDCNKIELEPDSYDLIVGHQGLHHIQELENLFEQAHRALKPTGLFFLSEWIGPNYLQIPATNRFFSTLLLYLLFPSKRMRTNHMGHTKGWTFMQYGKESFDPSEACNSENLESSLLKRFRYHKKVHFGGLCYPMFEGNAIHLSDTDPSTVRKVGWVIAIEKWLTRWGLIKPLFLVAICEKKPSVG
jgi:SAM-dependent methyltransferase